MSNETPQFFPNRVHKRLFGVLHRPDTTVACHDLAIVFCAPLFEEKLWSHRVMVNFARYLAIRGVSVLRFDYFGDGESEGRFEEASVATRVADIHDAVEFCRRQTGIETTYVLGLCYGATLALCAALSAETIAGAVAWAPIMDGERYAGELLRAHLTAQMVVHRKIIHDREALVRQITADQPVNIEGYEIGKALYAEMITIDLMKLLSGATKRVLVQQISPTERTDSQYAALTKPPNQFIEFRSSREIKFWTQQKNVFPPCDELFAQTAGWLLQAASH